ncbi:uncharacterized protein MONBRDRAFT_37688 [Monosiga brevicollis MX1]|uniref:Prolyl endopeptidase-like n=1 Tax=Monosiga brevicollis TaxID=81824 RepID=A9V3A5_MONBE|nr:uncharacterized protein MONBRDRAFT_37688 [Monosiga brevicollis MX1]EDQ88026.1 predicted protein [Monosiga brevicollis MX1]|eukprot:XP_001747102.1 hypothetical protein [Monosiga brevicollis MX1]
MSGTISPRLPDWRWLLLLVGLVASAVQAGPGDLSCGDVLPVARHADLHACATLNPGFPAVDVATSVLYPKARSVTLGHGHAHLLPRDLKVRILNASAADHQVLRTAVTDFCTRIVDACTSAPATAAASEAEETFALSMIEIFIHNEDEPLQHPLKEQYVLDVGMTHIRIEGQAVWGVHHALATLYQLIGRHNTRNLPAITGLPLRIEDSPEFGWRGLLVDTSRHFMPVPILKNLINLMATIHYNVLHLHLVDDQSFPVVVPEFPHLSEEGAWHNVHPNVYTPQDLEDLVNYAGNRSIRVVPEIDIPGHSASWTFGEPQLKSIQRAMGGATGYALRQRIIDAGWDVVREKKRTPIVWKDMRDSGMSVPKDVVLHVWKFWGSYKKPSDKHDGSHICAPVLAVMPAAGLEASTCIGPRADRRPHTITVHGDERVDFYYWLRDDKREDPDMIKLCKAENAHVEEGMAGTEDLREKLFKEMRGRIAEDDTSVPMRKGPYFYYTRFEKDKQYPIHCRRKLKLVPMQEEVYSLWLKRSEFDSPIIRYGYTSMTCPVSTFDVNLHDLKAGSVLKKMDPVHGYDASKYESRRLWAKSHDGVMVPISLVRRKDLPAGPNPVHLDGYGSYEISNDPWFSKNLLSLLDRGVVFALAHVRGGGDMGRMCKHCVGIPVPSDNSRKLTLRLDCNNAFRYEDGKYLKKANTWIDFNACAQFLVDEKIADPDRLTIEGRSAGGLLIGATLNTAPQRPDGKPFYAGAVAGVPFVDVLTTMLDDTIPLTVVEWEEWGNPHEKEYYDYMKSYSPVDQVDFRKGPYPPVLIKAGLHDPRVGYWEPLKYAQRLRDEGAQTVLCHVNMNAGHFSESGRFDVLKDVALDFAFILRALGLENAEPRS